jgi:putative transposase
MRGFRHWRWHLDEVYVKIGGEMRYLWRAVDHEGEVLECFVTTTRDKAAAFKFIEAPRLTGSDHHRRAALVWRGDG